MNRHLLQLHRFRMHTYRDERGLGGIEVFPLAVLVLFSGTMLILGLWSVIDAKVAATAAAREGARVAVEEFSSSEGEVAALETWTSLGKPTNHFQVAITNVTRRCQRVTSIVTFETKPLKLPYVGRWASYTVTAVHSEVVDPYRNGVLRGEADCG